MAKDTNTGRIRQEIRGLFKRAHSNRFSSIRIRAGDLHESIEFTQGSHPNQMPSCCNMMTEFEKAGDKRLYTPPRGRGANLLIEYKIPRN